MQVLELCVHGRLDEVPVQLVVRDVELQIVLVARSELLEDGLQAGMAGQVEGDRLVEASRLGGLTLLFRTQVEGVVPKRGRPEYRSQQLLFPESQQFPGPEVALGSHPNTHRHPPLPEANQLGANQSHEGSGQRLPIHLNFPRVVIASCRAPCRLS